MTTLFGTDGIRGVANEPPLTPELVYRVGRQLVATLRAERRVERAKLVIGRDTRRSGPLLESALAAGILSAGGDCYAVGVLPTPGIALLTRALEADGGIVLSASHNPFQDNGIKVFSGAGEKFTEALEERVESIVADPCWHVPSGDAGTVEQTDYRSEYTAHLRRVLGSDERLKGMRVAIDCANGATTTIAPHLFQELGCEVRFVGWEPDGRNINLRCGSTAPELLARTVVESGSRIGIAYGQPRKALVCERDGSVGFGSSAAKLNHTSWVLPVAGLRQM